MTLSNLFLYSVEYRDWNSDFSSLINRSVYVVGKDKQEAIQNAKKLAQPDSRDFNAIKIEGVMGMNIAVNQPQEALQDHTNTQEIMESYSLKAYIEHPDRPDDGGFSMPLPSVREVFEPFLENLRIKDIHNVKVGEIYSTHDGDNNLSYWLNEALRDMEGTKSLDELNYLAAKICGMSGEEREIFGAALQARWSIDSIGQMINLAQNLDCCYLQPTHSADSYGEFLIMREQDDAYGCLERLENSKNGDDRDFAQYIKRLEECVDSEAYGKMIAKEEGGAFTDYGYLRQEAEMAVKYRGIGDIPPEHRISKPSLMETLQRNAQKSREQFGDPASPAQIKEKEELDL